MIGRNYQIYYVVYEGIVVYIGCGKRGRYKHCNSGISHVYELNQIHFNNPDKIQVNILRWYDEESSAFEDEKYLIIKFKPKFNKDCLKTDERYEKTEEELLLFKGLTEKEIEILYSYQILKDYYNPTIKINSQLYEIIQDMYNKHITGKNYTEDFLKEIGPTLKENTISEIVSQKRNKNILKPSLEIGFYSNKKLKELIQDFYDENNLNLKAKASDISKWYAIKPAKSKGINGIRIEKIL